MGLARLQRPSGPRVQLLGAVMMLRDYRQASEELRQLPQDSK